MARDELFAGPGFRAREAGEADLPALQRFLEANPGYFLVTSGQAPGPEAAREEFEERPPEGWPWDGRWMIRFGDGESDPVALAEVVRNLLAPGVWHIGLFVVDTRLHGSGRAGAFYEALENWIREGGARWLRLNVAVGNARAERFWESRGFAEVRRREGVVIGARANTMRVMLKPLAGAPLSDYLALVARDRPGSP